MSTAPHLWRLLLDARANGARLVVVDPHRSRTARVADEHLRPLPGTDAALALGMMRAVRDDGLVDEDWCRAHATGLDELLERLDDFPLDRAAELTRVPAADIERVGLDFARTQPALLRLGRGRPAPPGRARPPTARSRRCRRWSARGATAAAAAPTSRPRRPPPSPRRRPGARTCARGPVRRINMSQLGDALTDRARPARRRARRLELEPGPDRPGPDEGARRPRARRPLHRRARAVHDRHGGARRRRAAGHHAARAPRRDLLLGPPLRDAEPSGDRAARRGEAEHRDLPAARRPARPRRPVLPRLRRGARRAGARDDAGPRDARRARRARLGEGRPRPGRLPRTPTAASEPATAGCTCTRTTSRRPRSPTPSSRRATRSR